MTWLVGWVAGWLKMRAATKATRLLSFFPSLLPSFLPRWVDPFKWTLNSAAPFFPHRSLVVERDRERERESVATTKKNRPTLISGQRTFCSALLQEFRNISPLPFLVPAAVSLLITQPQSGGMQNGSSVGICTHCIHVLARLAPTCMLSR